MLFLDPWKIINIVITYLFYQRQMRQLSWNNYGHKLATWNSNILLGIELELPASLRYGKWSSRSLGIAYFSSCTKATYNNFKVVVWSWIPRNWRNRIAGSE